MEAFEAGRDVSWETSRAATIIPHDEGLAHWFITQKPPTFFHQKPLAEGSSKNAAAVKIATGRYFRPVGRVLG